MCPPGLQWAVTSNALLAGTTLGTSKLFKFALLGLLPLSAHHGAWAEALTHGEDAKVSDVSILQNLNFHRYMPCTYSFRALRVFRCEYAVTNTL